MLPLDLDSEDNLDTSTYGCGTVRKWPTRCMFDCDVWSWSWARLRQRHTFGTIHDIELDQVICGKRTDRCGI